MAAAAGDLGSVLAQLGLRSVEDLSDNNLDDLGAAHSLEKRLESLDSTLLTTLKRALVAAEKVHNAPANSADAPNLVWTVLKEHDVDPRALSAFVYHVTKVPPTLSSYIFAVPLVCRLLLRCS